MIQILCSNCKRPIDPQTDNLWDLPRLDVKIGKTVARIGDVHACSKNCLVSWIQKNSEPSNIIATLGPAA